MLTKEQKALRLSRFGASEIGALYGVDPFKTLTDVITGKLFPEADGEQADHQEWGTDEEPALLANYSRRVGLDPLPLPGTVVHPKYDWLCATPDFLGLTRDRYRRMVEAKNVAVDNPLRGHWGEIGSSRVPALVQLQVTVTLGVLLDRNLIDDDEAEIAASIMGRAPGVPGYRLRFERDVFERIAEKALQVKRSYLDRGTIPALDGSDAARRYLHARWPRHERPMLPPSDEAKALHAELLKLEAGEKAVSERAAQIEQRLCALIGSAEGIEGVATWKRSKDSTTLITDWLAVTADLVALGVDANALRDIKKRHTAEIVTRTGTRKFLPVRPKKPKGLKAAKTAQELEP